MQAKRILWEEYRATWEAFSRGLDRLQACANSGDSAGGKDRLAEALLEVERAKAAHSEARDRLAAGLSDEITASDTAAGGPEEERIRDKARLLWELSGKPQGAAEADWYRAEQLVRSAAV